MNRFCDCKACKKQRKKGKIFGTRRVYSGGVSGGPWAVSDYVPFHKFLRGRVRKERVSFDD